MKRLAPLSLGFVLFSAHAVADPVVFGTASLTTSATFICLQAPACSSSGNTVTLGTGSGAVTLTFTGINTLVPITNEVRPVTLGTLSASSSSATFPTRTNPQLAIVGLDLTLAHTSPVSDSASERLLFGPGGRTALPFLMGDSYFVLDPGPVPSGYGPIIYSFSIPSIPMNGSADITAEAGVVPEPATMLLVGLGLAGATARRRARRPSTSRDSYSARSA